MTTPVSHGNLPILLVCAGSLLQHLLRSLLKILFLRSYSFSYIECIMKQLTIYGKHFAVLKKSTFVSISAPLAEDGSFSVSRYERY